MSNFIIMTDSSCDLPQEQLDKNSVKCVMLTVSLDGKDYINYPDWHEISPREFFDQLRAGKPSKTTAANVDQFREAMEPCLSEGSDVLYIGFSTGLSGTYNAGRLAGEELMEKYPGRRVICVDSLCASLGQGLLVDLVAEKRDSGADIDECARYAEEMKLKVAHWFTVDDLFYLHRGGRVSKTTAVVGSALGIKPVMHMDNEGKLVKVEVARGRKNSTKKLVDKMRDSFVSVEHVYISHGDCYEEAEQLMEAIKREFSPRMTLINHVGPVIGSHSGPGTMALFFVAKER